MRISDWSSDVCSSDLRSNITQETTCLTEPDRLEMVYIARFVSARHIPIHMPIGSRIPMYCTGSGRAFLSALPQDDALRLLQSAPRVAHTMHTRIDETELLDLLSDARRDRKSTRLNSSH